MSLLVWLQANPGLLGLAAVALYALLLLALRWRRSDQQPARLRPIAFYERLRALQSRAVETDASLHVALGSRSVLAAAPEIIAATTLAHSAAQATGTPARPLLLSSGEPTLFAVAAAVARPTADQAHSARVTLVGVEPLSYALGGWEAATAGPLAGQVAFGPHGAEGLLLQEGAHRDDGERLAGSAELDAAALLALGATAYAVGEEVYAASAQVGASAPRAGLALQDGLRLLLLLAMLVGLGLRLAGVWGG